MATKNINASWQFTKDAITVAEGYSVLTQGNWEALDLPHTWNGGKPGGKDAQSAMYWGDSEVMNNLRSIVENMI